MKSLQFLNQIKEENEYQIENIIFLRLVGSCTAMSLQIKVLKYYALMLNAKKMLAIWGNIKNISYRHTIKCLKDNLMCVFTYFQMSALSTLECKKKKEKSPIFKTS